jgi:hypothetical protein
MAKSRPPGCAQLIAKGNELPRNCHGTSGALF